MITHSKILFVGGGNMAQAIVAGLINSGCIAPNIMVVDKHDEKRAFLEKEYSVKTAESPEKFIPIADIIFLAIKPQGAKITCENLRSQLVNHTPLIISVMTGITIETLNTWLGEHLPIVRAMPNTPAIVQKAATGLFASSHVSVVHKQTAEACLNSIGITAWLNHENDLNIITALSGSGPAYYFYFMELMRNISIDMGLPKDIANSFAIQTAYGAGELAHHSSNDLAALRQQVTSKKGTTEAAINAMDERDLKSVLQKAMQACFDRAVVLSKEAG